MHEKFENLQELSVLLEKTDQAEIRPINDKNNIDIPEFVQIYNIQKDHTENIVPKTKGGVINHKDAFEPFVNALEQQQTTDYFGFFHNHGGRVSAEVFFKNVVIKDDSDNGVYLGFKFTNDYSRQSFFGEMFGYRSFCSNGMALGKSTLGNFSKNHKSISGLEKELLSYIDHGLSKTQFLEESIQKAIEDKLISEEDALKVLIGAGIREKTGKKILELLEVPDVFSRYALYNGITAHATHNISGEYIKSYYQGIAQKILVTDSNRLVRGQTKAELNNDF